MFFCAKLKKKGNDWKMRKSVKKLVALALTSAMAMAMTVNSYALVGEDITDVVGADTMFTAYTSMTGNEDTEWVANDTANLLDNTAIDNVKSFVITVPSSSDISTWVASDANNVGAEPSRIRFSICQWNEDVLGSNPRIFLGRPDLGPAEVDQNGASSGFNSQIRLTDDAVGDTSYKATVFFDTETYSIVIFKGTEASDFTKDNLMDYVVEYFGNDDAGATFASLADISGMTIQAYADKYVKLDKALRLADIAKIGLSGSSTIPALDTMYNTLAEKIIANSGKAAEKSEQTATPSSGSSSNGGSTANAGTTASSGQAAATATTAAKAAAKTGDTAPIALFAGLMVAVSAVAIVARRKSEA